jgi:glycosyltransferase involved in cell wall biosynthesis
VNLSRFAPGDTSACLRTKYHLPEDAILTGNIGQILPWKNQYDYLLVAGRLLQLNPKLHFFITGPVVDNAYYTCLREQIESRGLTSCFTFTGWIEDIVPYITGFSILLHTARDEPFGRVLIEAAAAAVPVIAYDSGGLSEIIEDGKTGYLVPDGDVDKMAELSIYLLENNELRNTMGRLAREHATRLFNGKDYARNVYRILNDNSLN